MFVGVLQVDVEIPEAQSLKDKRRVVKSVLDRMRRQFEVAAAEVSDQDVWNRAGLGIAVVSNARRHAESRLQKVLNALEDESDAIVVGSRLEVL